MRNAPPPPDVPTALAGRLDQRDWVMTPPRAGFWCSLTSLKRHERTPSPRPGPRPGASGVAWIGRTTHSAAPRAGFWCSLTSLARRERTPSPAIGAAPRGLAGRVDRLDQAQRCPAGRVLVFAHIAGAT